MADKFKNYYLKEKNWKFSIEIKESGELIAWIPDCGGMADMIPKSQDQMRWCEKEFGCIKNVKQIWNTVWQAENMEALSLIEKKIIDSGAVLEFNH